MPLPMRATPNSRPRVVSCHESFAPCFPQSTPRPAWAGSFGTSPVVTPTVRRIPRLPNCYAAMGYGWNGITFSMMAAQMLRTMILGSSDPDGDLMSFHRPF